MSKLLEIESKLKAIDPAMFQTLCDDYLHRKGNEPINRIGSAVGKRKTAKGTPDTYVPLPSGKYIFVEYSTEQVLQKKLEADLIKCFDVRKTGISADKIEKIILCHNGKVGTKELEHLRSVCKSHGGNALEVIGIDQLAFDLHCKYPILAKQHLGVELDTGQILEIDDFVEEYGRNQIASPLNTVFLHRKEEIKTVLDALKNNDVILIVGKAGVGKSRLALECAKRFVKRNRSYKSLCIFNKGLSLYENIRAYFDREENFLIIIDDANRISEANHIFRLLNEKYPSRKIKIIVTVRDYAIGKVRIQAGNAKLQEIELSRLSDQQLNEIVKRHYKIRNHYYLDRICQVAKGNPRLAMMAAKVACEKETLDSIQDVSGLYDEYFGSIVADLNEVGSLDLLKAAGIISLFRVIDRTQEENYYKIASAFHVTPNELWDCLTELHNMEIVDLLETEVARISDQVLATYFLYKTFIKDQVLNFSTVLDLWLDDNKFTSYGDHQIKEVIYPILDAFDLRFVCDRLQRHIDDKWNKINTDEAKTIHFLKVFWFLKETQALIYLNSRVNTMDACLSNVEDVDFAITNRITDDSYLGILKQFTQTSADSFEVAFEIILNYVEKNPKLVPDFLRLVTEDFSFNRSSHLRSYEIQRAVVTKIIERMDGPQSEFYTRIFLVMAKHYVQMQFQNSWMEGRLRLVMTEVPVYSPENLFHVREKLWKRLLKLYKQEHIRKAVIDVLSSYSHMVPNTINKEVAHDDSKQILTYIKEHFDAKSYIDCVAVQDYIALLEQSDIAFPRNLKTKFQNDTYKISVMLRENNRRKYRHLEWEQRVKSQQQELKRHFVGYDFDSYKSFLSMCEEILSYSLDHERFQIRDSIVRVLINLSEANSNLFKQVIKHIVMQGNPLALVDARLVRCLTSCYSNNKVCYELLKNGSFQGKTYWILYFLESVGQKPDKFFLNEIYRLYEIIELIDCRSFDYLQHYQQLDERIIPNVLSILFERSKKENMRMNLENLFSSWSYVSENLEHIFKNDVGLLKQIYLSQLCNGNFDYRGESLQKIINMDAQFIYEYIDWMYENHKYLTRYDDHTNFKFLWIRDDYKTSMIQILDYLHTKETGKYRCGEYPGVFFIKHAEDIDERVEKRKTEVIKDYIRLYHADKEKMYFVFQIVANFQRENYGEILSEFLRFNKKFSVFRILSMSPLIHTYSGSEVPMREKEITFLETLLPVCKGIELLEHQNYVEECIKSNRQRISEVVKREFIENAF